jgi:hypothetical protein
MTQYNWTIGVMLLCGMRYSTLSTLLALVSRTSTMPSTTHQSSSATTNIGQVCIVIEEFAHEFLWGLPKFVEGYSALSEFWAFAQRTV